MTNDWGVFRGFGGFSLGWGRFRDLRRVKEF
jgi:hypothetical protein